MAEMVTKEDARRWLIENSHDRVLKNPIDKAQKDGLCVKTMERFLKAFEEEGFIKISFGLECTGERGRPRKKMEMVEFGYYEKKKGGVILRRGSVGGIVAGGSDKSATNKTSLAPSKVSGGEAMDDDRKSSVKKPSEPILPEKDGVIVIFDYDNTSLCYEQKRGKKMDLPSMYDAVMCHAKKLGVVLKREAFITTRTEDRDYVVLNFFSLDQTPVVIVPPQKDAADEKMIESVEFSLMVPRIKAVVIVSDDANAFGPLCGKIKEAGCEAHVVTTGFVSPTLARMATKVISLPDLMRRAGMSEAQISSQHRDRFHNAARCISQGVEPSNDEEKFVVICLDTVRALTREPGSWLNFHRLYEGVWRNMEGDPIRNLFNLEDCKYAIEALITIQLIGKSIFPVGENGNSAGYFAR